MSKLYYTDPLAAAIMARDFGVELYSNHTDEQMDEYDKSEPQRSFRWFDSCLTDGWMHDVEMVSDAIRFIEDASDKIYVYPDNYDIFQPKVGDKDEDGFRFEGGAWVRFEMNGTKRILMANESYTAKRNNKPFFTPLEEENES